MIQLQHDNAISEQPENRLAKSVAEDFLCKFTHSLNTLQGPNHGPLPVSRVLNMDRNLGLLGFLGHRSRQRGGGPKQGAPFRNSLYLFMDCIQKSLYSRSARVKKLLCSFCARGGFQLYELATMHRKCTAWASIGKTVRQ